MLVLPHLRLLRPYARLFTKFGHIAHQKSTNNHVTPSYFRLKKLTDAKIDCWIGNIHVIHTHDLDLAMKIKG